jgi:hypothetical protein
MYIFYLGVICKYNNDLITNLCIILYTFWKIMYCDKLLIYGLRTLQNQSGVHSLHTMYFFIYVGMAMFWCES